MNAIHNLSTGLQSSKDTSVTEMTDEFNVTLYEVNFRIDVSNFDKKEKKNPWSENLSLCLLCLCNNIKPSIIN